VKRLAAALLFVALVAGALVLTTRDEDPEIAVPALTVTRMDGEGDFELTQLASADTPTLLWFWAPWCTVCNGEAPKIQQLAEQTRGELSVVAIGGRDDLANGPEFVSRHGLTAPTLLFDESMQVWEHYRIPGQPGAILLDADGVERGRWLGAFDTNLAVEAAQSL
jgi:thiol-disulfide isomerase/thioredoxin